MDKVSALRKYFGLDGFRPGQERLIDDILSGRDCLGIMPTGGGKSLCYQLPALLLPGLTLVVSPLISLMKDQVEALREDGIPAANLNSSLDTQERREVLAGLGRGEFRLLYIAPERLDSRAFASLAQELEISLTLALENEEVPETSIALYRYDGSYCLAVVDGEPTALVQRSAAVDLIEAVNAFVLG